MREKKKRECFYTLFFCYFHLDEFLQFMPTGLSEVFHCIILISDGDGRARIGQGECHTRTVYKIDFELGLGLTNGFYFRPAVSLQVRLS
jgi:hypothetical protein